MASAALPLPVMTPGTYLRLRREAARLTIASLARLVTSSPVELAATVLALTEAEADRGLLSDADLRRIRLHVPLDVRIYGELIDGRLAFGVCLVCGCSWDDACPGGCAWVTSAEDLCSTCQGRAR